MLLTMIVCEIQRLHLIFIGQLIETQTFSGDTCINFTSKVIVVLNDLSSGHRVHSILSGLNYLSEHLNLSPLNLSNQPVLVFSFSDLDFSDSPLVLLFDILLPLSQGWLQQIELIILDFLDLSFSLIPFLKFLFLHQFPPQQKWGFIRSRRQSILKSNFLPLNLNIFHLIHSSR